MYRYTVAIDDEPHKLRLHGDPVAPAAGIVGRYVEFWAMHDRGFGRDRVFQVFGTGQPVPDGAAYIGTCPRDVVGCVWHLFEVTR
jgi:hypothetical protein